MTLIAAWAEAGTPILLGDLLISAPGQFEGRHYSLPTRDDVDEILPSEWGIRIVDTRQKVYKISDSFAVAWAGSEAAARVVIEGLLDRFGRTAPEMGDVYAWLSRNTGLGSTDCVIIGWVITKDAQTAFRWSSNAPADLKTGPPFIEGTGAPYLQEILGPATVTGSDVPLFHALGRIANLLGHEVLYGRTLRGLFGGGFQLAYVDNSAITMLPSVTYVFLYAKEEAGQLLFSHWHRGLKVEYDYEMVQTMVITKMQGERLARTEMYYALPITADFVYLGSEPLSLESVYYCVWVDIFLQDGLRGQQIAVMGNGGKEPWLRIVRNADGSEALQLGEELFRQIERDVRSMPREKNRYGERRWLL